MPGTGNIGRIPFCAFSVVKAILFYFRGGSSWGCLSLNSQLKIIQKNRLKRDRLVFFIRRSAMLIVKMRPV
jgi:hypothetical protein